MGDTRISTSGGTTSDGVNAAATLSSDGSAVQILVYNHVTGGTGDSSKASQVKLTVNNLPGTGALKIRHYLLDRFAISRPRPRARRGARHIRRTSTESAYSPSAADPRRYFGYLRSGMYPLTSALTFT